LNARDAMPRGGTIELSLSADASLAQISVRDFGVGMPEEVQAQLFTPFFTTKGTRGTGLGLRVVKSTMDEHKGSVLVESQPGEGTTFRLRIPLLPGVEESGATAH
jgi:signal transduction histidine kinase